MGSVYATLLKSDTRNRLFEIFTNKEEFNIMSNNLFHKLTCQYLLNDNIGLYRIFFESNEEEEEEDDDDNDDIWGMDNRNKANVTRGRF